MCGVCFCVYIYSFVYNVLVNAHLFKYYLCQCVFVCSRHSSNSVLTGLGGLCVVCFKSLYCCSVYVNNIDYTRFWECVCVPVYESENDINPILVLTTVEFVYLYVEPQHCGFWRLSYVSHLIYLQTCRKKTLIIIATYRRFVVVRFEVIAIVLPNYVF